MKQTALVIMSALSFGCSTLSEINRSTIPNVVTPTSANMVRIAPANTPDTDLTAILGAYAIMEGGGLLAPQGNSGVKITKVDDQVIEDWSGAILTGGKTYEVKATFNGYNDPNYPIDPHITISVYLEKGRKYMIAAAPDKAFAPMKALFWVTDVGDGRIVKGQPPNWIAENMRQAEETASGEGRSEKDPLANYLRSLF